MASKGYSYGLSAQCQRKIDGKRDPELEKQVQDWIETITGESFKGANYVESLRDGVLLCQLMNKLQPGSVKKINPATSMNFKLMENIGNFQTAANNYGVNQTDLFQTASLFDRSNIPQVTQCIFALGRVAQTKPGYQYPILGPKQADQNVRDWSDEQMEEQAKLRSEIGLQMGQNKGATQAGQNFGLGRQIGGADRKDL